MIDGKVAENVLKRAVLSRIKEINKDVITGAAFGKDCAILNCKEKTGIATGTAIGLKNGRYAIYKAANNLAAEGFQAKSFTLNIIIPSESEESELKSLMDELVYIAYSLNSQIINGNTEVSSQIKEAIISVTAIGDLFSNHQVDKLNIKPGDKILATKWIGIEGCAIIYNARKEELTDRFGTNFLARVERYHEWVSCEEEAKLASLNKAIAMKDVSERGIFAALWELGSVAGKGLKVNLKDIPVRQEVVEICNYLNINPYALKSQGMMLIVARETEAIIEELDKVEIPYSIIGEFTDNNDRIVINEDEIRHLDKIKQDEIYKVI